MNNKKWGMVLGGTIIFLLFVIVGSIEMSGHGKKEDKVIIGVILPGSVEEVGWNGIHYHGIQTACEELGVEIMLRENAAEYSGECEKAVEEMADAGIKAIVLESYNYPDEILNTIKAHPEISFYCCSSEWDISNYKAYFARVYQARYLSGIVAGMKTQTNQIGYVAAMNNSEVNRGINAFTLGVRSVNPDANVFVSFTESWDNEEREKQETYALVEYCNVDVLTYHQNQPFVVETAEELGIDVIGYNMEKGEYSEHLLTSVISNWNMVYKEIISDYLQMKEIGVRNYWIGIEKDAVGLGFYSNLVSQNMIDAVDAAKRELIEERDVFSGVIYDNTGKQRCKENEVIRDEILLQQMNWFVEGVILYEDN